MSTRADGAAARFLADETGGAGPATRAETTYVRIDRWHTHVDDRTCPVCLALDWQEFAEDTGPWPPLHTHCRCGREIGARYEARTREVDARDAGSGEGSRP